ncbi:hypothetical protein PQX77_011573 [Marasmius sp. AFHP31]|nr:hypothetical protein PQX77_011573 [Marasmius sp. AFHP31]
MAFEEHDEETTPLLPGASNLNSRKLNSRIRAKLSEQLDAKDCVPVLVLLNFVTGFLDAISYATLRIWAAFQTGNSLQLSLALSRLTVPSSDIPPEHPSRFAYAFTLSDRVAIASLVFFNLGAFVGGYIVNSTTRKTRGWMLVSTLVQLVLTLAATLIIAHPPARDIAEPKWMNTSISLVLIALSLGVQGIQAKRLGTSQFGTTLVLTTAWVDMMNSPWRVGRLRDHKALPIVSLIMGGFVGGTLLRYVGTPAALGVVVILRFLVGLGWFIVPPVPEPAYLAARGNGGRVDVVGSANTETPAGKGSPQSAPVGTGVPVGISLDPSITSGGESWVARLKGESVNEETEEDDVSFAGVGVGAGVGGETVCLDESGIDVVEHVGPGEKEFSSR